MGLLEETYELVKSLSKTEKRYFKLYTQFQQGDKSYLKLFDVIDKQPGYNEKIINQKFLAKNKITNFPSIKKYLFDQMVASIKSYGAYKDLDSDHTDLIETYKVLNYKGLHGQSDRLLKKIKQLTLEDDAFTRHFSVLLLEYLKEVFNPDDANDANIIRVLKERRNTLNIIDNYLTVAETYTMVRLHLRKKFYCRNKKDKEELTKVIAPLLKTTETDMLSRTALSNRNTTLCDYYLATGQPKKAFETSKIYLELRKNAGRNDKLEMLTLNEYLQHSVICIRSGIYEGFEENMIRFKSLIDTIRNKEKYFIAYEKWYNCQFIYYNRTGQFEDGAAFAESEYKKEPVEKNFSMKAKITLWYFIAYNCYARHQYKKSLQYIQQIMNQPDNDLEEFIFAKLLLMYIHYELKNYELLEYQIRSAQRFMEKKERFYQSEKLMLHFFKTVSGADTKKVRHQQLEELKKNVTALFKTWYERGFSYYFDIQSWIESERTGENFAEVVRRNNFVHSVHE
ncbi:MAG: hypothetical protein ABIN97_06910 [Ginsengibacter sp.]